MAGWAAAWPSPPGRWSSPPARTGQPVSTTGTTQPLQPHAEGLSPLAVVRGVPVADYPPRRLSPPPSAPLAQPRHPAESRTVLPGRRTCGPASSPPTPADAAAAPSRASPPRAATTRRPLARRRPVPTRPPPPRRRRGRRPVPTRPPPPRRRRGRRLPTRSRWAHRACGRAPTARLARRRHVGDCRRRRGTAAVTEATPPLRGRGCGRARRRARAPILVGLGPLRRVRGRRRGVYPKRLRRASAGRVTAHHAVPAERSVPFGPVAVDRRHARGLRDVVGAPAADGGDAKWHPTAMRECEDNACRKKKTLPNGEEKPCIATTSATVPRGTTITL